MEAQGERLMALEGARPARERPMDHINGIPYLTEEDLAENRDLIVPDGLEEAARAMAQRFNDIAAEGMSQKDQLKAWDDARLQTRRWGSKHSSTSRRRACVPTPLASRSP